MAPKLENCKHNSLPPSTQSEVLVELVSKVTWNEAHSEHVVCPAVAW